MFADAMSGAFAFGYGFAGFGAELAGTADGVRRNFWSLCRTPFFKMLGDHPAYFLDRHYHHSDYLVNVYGYPEHRDFYARIAPGRPAAVPPVAPIDPLDAKEIDFDAKTRGKVYFLKNGNDPEALRAKWRERLGELVARTLLELSEALTPSSEFDVTCVDIERIATRHVAERLYFDLSTDVRLLALYVAQLDDYVRRVKSTLIARAVLDLPVEVHGELWSHVDFEGRRAKLVSSGDYFVSRELLRGALAIIDMSPNSALGLHERFVRAASRHTLCITNDTPAIAPVHSNATAATFRFSADSIRDRVAWALEHPEAAVALGASVGEAFGARHSTDDLTNFFDGVTQHFHVVARGNPFIQDFFVWPPVGTADAAAA